MSRIQSFVMLLTLLSAVVSGTAHAVQRTHVSAAFGSDANTVTNCTAAAPCRFFQAAMTVTDNNGEVIVLDSGGYGAVTITKSLSLIAPTGVYAGISVFPGADGVTIATAGVNVVLRGLTINGQGGNYGIIMTTGTKLTVENCVIANLAQSGIHVNGAASVRVTDTTIRDNLNYALDLRNGARGTVTRATVSGNGGAITAQGNVASTTTTADVADSTMDANGYGITAGSSVASAVARVAVRDSRIVLSTFYGMYVVSTAGAAVTVSISNSLVTNNNFAWFLSGAGTVVRTLGNNHITDNTTSFGSLTPVTSQ